MLISIPSVLSPNLTPHGKHVLHAYMPGTEPFELWEGLDRRSAEYRNLKAERSEVGISVCCLITFSELCLFGKMDGYCEKEDKNHQWLVATAAIIQSTSLVQLAVLLISLSGNVESC